MQILQAHLENCESYLLEIAFPPFKEVAAPGQQYVDSQIANAKTAYLTTEILHPKGDKESLFTHCLFAFRFWFVATQRQHKTERPAV